ncbi:uncharacterized protein PV09_01894 [Verruconis gallopava]|uniref:Uncharacterized protein n=1 Tax=Verruconis gallopava TaxID=253628 RepID=A0A0D2B717_9PEZI|nr:uncharacterized protein PV09_01894 [Verruconis gallopava]KIW06999.1 hypothetical protein PV09_01894 [Verruconis gallopava]
MRLSFISVLLWGAFSLASPSAVNERSAAPDPNPVASSDTTALHPAVEALVERSIAERQSLTDIATLLNDIGPTLQALGTLLNSNTLNEIISVISHANALLDDEGTAAAHSVLIQANRLLSENNTDTLITLFNDVGPLITELSPLFSSLNSVLTGLSNFFGIKA